MRSFTQLIPLPLLSTTQLSTKYNVEYIDQLRKPFQRAFDLNVENLHFWGRNASHMEMTVCARYVANFEPQHIYGGIYSYSELAHIS